MDKRRMDVNTTTIFYVRNRTTGGQYLVNRASRTAKGKYRWNTDKSEATLMTYDAAQKAALRYGGQVIRREILVIDQPTRA